MQAINLPAAVLRQAETAAAQFGLPLDELCAKAIAEFVANHQADMITRQLNSVYEVQPSGIDPTLATMQALSTANEDW